MGIYLNDFIQTLTSRRQERVSTILEEAKAGKDDITVIAQRLLSFKDFAPLVMSREVTGGKIGGNTIALNFRDIDVQMSELYRIANLVSDLVNSDIAVLTSQVKALEDELSALEKLADNYGFLLSDGGAFNYAFLEPFNDENGRDSFEFVIPDRASQNFGPAELAEVRSDEGVLALTSKILTSNPISGSIINANASAFVVENNGISNATTSTAGTGWRYVVATPNPVSSSIPEANGRAGAQILLEFLANTPAPVSELNVVPFAEHPIEIIRVIAFDDATKNDNGVDLLNEPVLIDRPYTLHFPARTIAKFKILINQPVYERTVDAIHGGEEDYRKLWDAYKARREVDPRYKFIESIFQSPVMFSQLEAFLRIVNFVRQLRGETVFSIPDIVFDADYGPLRVDAILTQLQIEGGGSLDMWFPPNVNQDFYHRYVASDPGLFLSAPFPNPNIPQNSVNQPNSIIVLGNTSIGRFGNTQIPPILSDAWRVVQSWQPRMQTKTPLDQIDAPPSLFTTNPPRPRTATFGYTYYLGMEYIGIGMSSPTQKGVFISKSYDSEGDIGELRMKVSHVNFETQDLKDNRFLTSVEYSVSNVSSPKLESHWIPILPIDTTRIASERLFPSGSGVCLFRFTANLAEGVRVFRNGFDMKLVGTDLIHDAAGQTILGVKLPLGETSAADIFTVSYIPSHDFTTVNFATAGFIDVPLVASHDVDGAGEGFLNSGGRNIIDLAHNPYVDENQVQNNITSKVSTYQPITIVFANGDVGQNLTNYGPGAQTPLPAPPTAIPAYIHSGSSIIFNDEITQSFRVYYQYLQNNVRTRIVLRVDDKSFVSPKVDFVQIKAKTRRANRAEVM